MSVISRRSTQWIGAAAAAALLTATPLAAQAAGQGPVAGQPASAETLATLRAAIKSAERANGHAGAASTAVGGVKALAEPSACTDIEGFSPNKIVLGAKSVKKTFSVSAPNCAVESWAVLAVPFVTETSSGSYTGIAGNYEMETGQVLKPTITLNPRLLWNEWAGKSSEVNEAYVLVYDEADGVDSEPAEATFTLQLLRHATFGSTFNASPEPVKKGKKITLTGTLGRINWNQAKTLKYGPYSKRKVQVQFKATGTSTWKNIKTVTTNSKGKISTTVKASKTGGWRLYFAGNAATSPATSKADGVTVTN